MGSVQIRLSSRIRNRRAAASEKLSPALSNMSFEPWELSSSMLAARGESSPPPPPPPPPPPEV